MRPHPASVSIGQSVRVDYEEAAQKAETVAARLVGLDEAAARFAVEKATCVLHVGRRDGVSYSSRTKLDPRRIRVSIEDGVVTSVEVG
jgi:hypothetical protein